ncbi:MAG: NAD(P)/FAD-dependent oxidoreductase [Rhodobacteraceae bacterium]|jgi:L-2-hydroxyglutarate oxidase LhgO|nr:NAD(P)/FAD-dependent oxidoreductase [Paracoccaceae bacterium]
MDRADCVVIGAGVIGLAAARALARAGREVILAEAEAAIGQGTSSRNSEVIHAGIYYPQDSLKARFCVAGRRALYAYCAGAGVPCRRIGKLIVVARGQEAAIDALAVRGTANGVEGLRRLPRAEVLALEPELDVAAALLSPDSGIVDSHALMLALLADAEEAGAVLALRTPVTRGRLTEDGVMLEAGGHRLMARTVVNAAGLSAHRVAAAIDGAGPAPEVRFARGNYFAYRGAPPFARLVYPLPEVGGLGVHATIDMAGRVRFGPDVEWISAPGYDVDPGRAAPFYAAIRSYWPGLPDDTLHADYAGVRVKLGGHASPDFRIDADAGRRLIQLFGIESPGLTASLALGAHVAERACAG